MVTWHLTMKLFPAKCHGRATLRKLWRQTGKFHCYPRNVDRCCWNLSVLFKIYFRYVLLYNKSLNDWSLGEQWIWFPSNLNVSLDFVSGNIEILGKQSSLFPSGPVIKCLMFHSWHQSCQQLFWHWEKLNFLIKFISESFCLFGLLNSR